MHNDKWRKIPKDILYNVQNNVYLLDVKCSVYTGIDHVNKSFKRSSFLFYHRWMVVPPCVPILYIPHIWEVLNEWYTRSAVRRPEFLWHWIYIYLCYCLYFLNILVIDWSCECESFVTSDFVCLWAQNWRLLQLSYWYYYGFLLQFFLINYNKLLYHDGWYKNDIS